MTAATVSIINLKGGVGKSTLTMLLGEFLAFHYLKNVLLIDMDAQANLSYCMVADHRIHTQAEEGRTTYHLLRAGFENHHLDIGDYITQPPLVVSNIRQGVLRRNGIYIHMVISTPTVAQLDEDLMQLWDEGKPMPKQVRQTLQQAIEPALDRYDYILIDCPPGLSVFSSAALIASDYYISPVIPEPLSLQGVDLVQDRSAQMRQRFDAKAEFKGIILNIVKHYRNTHRRESEKIYSSDGIQKYAPFDYWLPDNELLRKIGEYDPDIKGEFAMGSDRKFPSLHAKYGVKHQLTNPSDGLLSRREEEGPKYHLEDRISNLVTEFLERCPQG